MSWIALTISVLAIVAASILRLQRPKHQDMLDYNRAIADFSCFPATSLEHRLCLRAGPNASLISTLGIHNSFTTTDVDEHSQFLACAIRSIRSADADAWTRVWQTADATLHRLVSVYKDKAPGQPCQLPIERVMRVFCLDAVLELLFSHARTRPMDLEVADAATAAINELWLKSKDPEKVDVDALAADKEMLWQMMDALVPWESNTRENHVLSLLIPAYETLWRVVLLTYVHIAFRGLEKTAQCVVQEAVRDLEGAGRVAGKLSPSLEQVANEALRLYPPTKRLYRLCPSSGERSAADIEALHHDKHIWGPKAMHFQPQRFAALTDEQKLAFIPFGIRPNACPARNEFGKRMIGLLVAKLLVGLGTAEAGVGIRFGDERLDGALNVPLPTGRDDARSWVVTVAT